MHLKFETQQISKDFITQVENQFDTKVKAIRTDNGAGIILHAYYSYKSIIH